MDEPDAHLEIIRQRTDLQMLLAFANKLQHKTESLLRQANVDYTKDNVPFTAVKNYDALKEIFPELKGLALFDRIEKKTDAIKSLQVICWQRRELENYFARPNLLIKHAKELGFQYRQFTAAQLENFMQQAISDYTLPAYTKNMNDEWWNDAKLSDEWLDKIFPAFYKQLGIRVGANFKKDYYQLIALLDKKDIPVEVSEKLDLIYGILK